MQPYNLYKDANSHTPFSDSYRLDLGLLMPFLWALRAVQELAKRKKKQLMQIEDSL